MTLPPVIKWSGSKRAVAQKLSGYFPRHDLFVDPFVGGGSMLAVRKAKSALAGDSNKELIALWQRIQEAPASVAAKYEELWARLQAEGHTAFYHIRDSFNALRRPEDLLFLSRTCVNGLIRFNSRGEFNNSLHHTRKGIEPERLRDVLLRWGKAVQQVEFIHADFEATIAQATRNQRPFIFLDPPYFNTRGRYTAGFDGARLLLALEDLNAKGFPWMLTYDGKTQRREYENPISPKLFSHKFFVATGNAPFVKTQHKTRDAVLESVYLNFDPGLNPSTEHGHERGEFGGVPVSNNVNGRLPLLQVEVNP